MTPLERLHRRLLVLEGFRSRHDHAEGLRIHSLSAQGSGPLPTAVVLHGLAAQSGNYAPLLGHLLPRVRSVIAPDLPGHGTSEGGDLADPRRLEAAMMAWLDDVSARAPIMLLGNSLGGMLAARFAARRPERVHSLTLVSPGGAAMAPAELQALVASFRIEGHTAALGFVDRVFAKRPGAVRRHAIALGVRARMTAPPLQRFLARIEPKDLLSGEEISALRMPTLLIWGRQERLLPGSVRDFFVAHLPAHAEVEHWHDFGHIGCLEHAAAIARRAIQQAEGARSPGRRLDPQREFTQSANGFAPVASTPQVELPLKASA